MRKTSKTTAQRSQSVNEGQLRGKGTHSEQEQPPLREGAVLQRLKRAPAKSGLSGQIFLWAASESERAAAVRLVRILRTNYWFSNLMEQLLRLEADNPFQVTIEAVRKQIDGLESIETLVKKIQFIGSSPGNYFRDHPAVRAVHGGMEGRSRVQERIQGSRTH